MVTALAAAAEQLQHAAREGMPPAGDLLREHLEQLDDDHGGTDATLRPPDSLSMHLSAWLAELERSQELEILPGVPTGFDRLDDVLGSGLHPGQLVVLGFIETLCESGCTPATSAPAN